MMSHRLTVTVPQAATTLGITEGAVRGRVKRGTLRSYREAGTVYVLLEGAASSASRDELGGSPADKSELVAVLREQLAAERQVHAEARRIIAGLAERIPGHRGPTGAPEASATVEEEPEKAEPYSAAGESQEPVQRPWWRRVFGR